MHYSYPETMAHYYFPLVFFLSTLIQLVWYPCNTILSLSSLPFSFLGGSSLYLATSSLLFPNGSPVLKVFLQDLPLPWDLPYLPQTGIFSFVLTVTGLTFCSRTHGLLHWSKIQHILPYLLFLGAVLSDEDRAVKERNTSILTRLRV